MGKLDNTSNVVYGFGYSSYYEIPKWKEKLMNILARMLRI